MKKLLTITLTCLFILSPVWVQAQQKGPNIAFADQKYDFGEINETDGVANYKFEFNNTGSSPLIINRVTASCGCTTPGWTKKPVAPGEKGYIDVAFNPKGRSGVFNKTVAVYSNAARNVVTLRIKGNIVPRPRTVEDDYPYLVGGMRMGSNHMAFTKVYSGEKKKVELKVINSSDEDMEIAFDQVPAHVQLEAVPSKLKPGEKGILKGEYNSEMVNDWGFMVHRARLVINGVNDRNNLLTISATITENFSGMSKEEKANAAKIEFTGTTFNFGKMQQRSSVEHNFVFTNTGKSDLMIRKVKSSCGCTAVSPKEKLIKPGASSSIKAIFNSGTRKGKQTKTITVITNDPVNPTVMLRVSGEVEEPANRE